jgi:hypothetical protein
MLSLFALAVISFSFGARLETLSGANFALQTQARLTSTSSFASALPLLSEATSVTTTLQPWNQALAVTSAPTRRAQSASRSGRSMDLPGTQAVIEVNDLSSRVNLNTIRNRRSLERYLDAVFASAKESSGGGNAAQRARTLFALRDGRSAVDMLTTQTMQPDLRMKPVAGSGRFDTFADLQKGKTGLSASMFTPEELQTLAPHLTLFSQNPETYTTEDGASHSRKAITEEMSADEIHEALRELFPGHDNRLLLQFAANLADFVDTDNVPTVLTDPNHPQPWNALIGLEKAPFITEVYPDSLSEETDAGQFVEIANPWNEPINLVNWRLAIGGGMSVGSPGSVVTINTVLPAGGTLVLTDNYETPAINAPPGTGSLVSIFGQRADGVRKKIVESRQVQLPDKNSFVVLADAAGRPVDVFSYTETAGRDTRSSYQRNDPRVRSFAVGESTPFERAPAGIYTGTPEDEATLRSSVSGANAPLQSSVDLLRISTAYVGLSGAENAPALRPHPWQISLLEKPQQAGEQTVTNLDLRLVDMFLVPQVWPETAALADYTTATLADQRTADDDLKTTITERDGTYYSYGKLNLNTCAKEALYSLDLAVDGRDFMSDDVIERFAAFRDTRLAARQTPFRNPSDLLIALFPPGSEVNPAVLGKLLDQTTVGSSAFEVVTSNRNLPGEANGKSGSGQSNRSPAKASMQWAVALDRQPCSLLGVRSLP